MRRGMLIALVLAGCIFLVGSAADETIDVVNNQGWTVSDTGWAMLGDPNELPGIEVRLNEFPFADMLGAETRELQLGSGAFDVLMGTEAWMPVLAPFMTPITDFVEADPTVDLQEFKDSFFPLVLEQHSTDGIMTSTPIMGGVQIGYYLKDLFEDPAEQAAFKAEYGYDLPTPNENGVLHFSNEGQFLEVAQFFTRDTDGDGAIDLWGYVCPGQWGQGGCMFEDRLFRAGFYPWALLNEEYKCPWGSEYPENWGVVESIARFAQDLIWKYKVTPPEIVQYAYTDAILVYLSGKAAMSASWYHDFWGQVNSDEVIADIGETGTFSLDFHNRAPRAGTFAGFWGWGIASDTDSPQAAYEFVKWWSSEDTQRRMIEKAFLEGGGIYVPPNINAAAWAAGMGYIPPASYESTLDDLYTLPMIPELPELRNAHRGLHEQLLLNEITPIEFRQRSGETIEQIMTDAGYYD